MYIQINVLTLGGQFVSMCSSSSSFDKENTTNIVYKILFFMSGLVQKVLDTEMGDEVLYPPFSFVYDPAFTYCASSHCNVSESNFK